MLYIFLGGKLPDEFWEGLEMTLRCEYLNKWQINIILEYLFRGLMILNSPNIVTTKLITMICLMQLSKWRSFLHNWYPRCVTRKHYLYKWLLEKKNEKQGFEFIDTESYLLRTNDTFQYIDLTQRHIHVMWLPSTCTAQSLPTEEAFQMRSFWLKKK